MTITSLSLLAVSFKRYYPTAIVFLTLTLTEDVFLVCVRAASSFLSWNIKVEFKNQKQKKSRKQMPGNNNSQPLSRQPRQRHESPMRRRWLITILDILAGIGVMGGAIVIITQRPHETRTINGFLIQARPDGAIIVMLFIVMALQWIIALVGLCPQRTIIKLTIISHPKPSFIEASLPLQQQSFRDSEQEQDFVGPRRTGLPEDDVLGV